MLDTILEKLISAMLGGGPQAIIAVLLFIIALMFAERRRLLKELQRKDDKIEKIVDDYYKGNLTLSEALNSLKLVLFEIKIKMGP